MNWKKDYEAKRTSAAEAVKLVRSGDRVYAGTASSVAYGLLAALWDRRHELENVEIQSSQAFEPSPIFDETADNPFHYLTYFIGVGERKVYRGGLPVNFTSVHLSQVNIWSKETAKPDVAFFEVSAPDEDGYFSYGASGVACGEEIKKTARTVILQVNNPCSICNVTGCVILQVNKEVPYVLGEHHLIHVSEADALVEIDRPLKSYDVPESDEVAKQLAALILQEVPDGATLQLGLGNVSTAIGYGLKEKNDLGIHTELFNQPMLALIENGNVTNKHKGFLDGKNVYAFALGNEKLYRFWIKILICTAYRSLTRMIRALSREIKG